MLTEKWYLGSGHVLTWFVRNGLNEQLSFR